MFNFKSNSIENRMQKYIFFGIFQKKCNFATTKEINKKQIII